jgi:iron complex outermembrane receptor protein
VSGEVSGFANFISDYIYFAPAIGADGQPVFDVLIRGAFPRFVTRPVDALFWGADGQVSASPVPWLGLGAQASAVRARNLTDHSYLVFVPPDQLRVSVAISRNALLGLENPRAFMAGSYTARQSRFDPTADLAPPPDAYFLAEAALEAQTRVAGQAAKVALQGTNIFGRRYREYTSLLRYFADQPARQLMLRISLAYGSSRTGP